MGVLVTVCCEGVFLPEEREWDSRITPINNSFRRSLLYIRCTYGHDIGYRADLRTHVFCSASLKADHFIFNGQNRITALRHL